MFLANSQSNFNVIQPIPRFYTTRFGRYTKIDDDDNEHDDNNHEYKINQFNQVPNLATNENNNSLITITGIRNRDWNFHDNPKDFNDKDIPHIKYQVIPSISNTIKNRSSNCTIDNTKNQYEEYDLDEQDFQWLIAYNQFRTENHLLELDENIFEYIMQLFEQQCIFALRQKNYADTIQCDACFRIDDVDDLIQCTQCKTIIHKKCYGLDVNQNQWICSSCQFDNNQQRCCICDKNRGILKVLKTSSDEQWIHPLCAFWFPEIVFDEQMTPILKDIPPENDGLCLLCYKTVGVKINCCWKNCQNQFHAKCAIEFGLDMFIAENDDNTSVRLLALCQRHTEKLDSSEKRIRINKFLETKQKRFEQFASYIDLDKIKEQTIILPDILESIHAYWILKRQTNNCRPLIDLPDDIFYHEYDKNINLVEFARQYHLEHQNHETDLIEEKSNMLQFLATNLPTSIPLINNIFVKFARRHRIYFNDYERNRFCLLDGDKKKRERFSQYIQH
ncbi:unnamed protein product [Adineta steineri]|uniref:PHD-type domain-containing protein n=1 Tax=Adineta steineri TaxID=433720 RepID=A0A814BN48_9BILA|nr:unnamed protein product [Adineta steineri]CAF3749523.1 unnamed protein product [Adineta steineri]